MKTEYKMQVKYLESRDVWMAFIEDLDLVSHSPSRDTAIQECAELWDFYALVSHHHEAGTEPIVLPTLSLRPNSFELDGDLYEIVFGEVDSEED